MLGKEKEDFRLHNRFITSYKKNTIAVFYSFTLTFLLLTAMLVMLHTNHRTANIQYKTEFTPSDCYIEDLSKQQIEKLKEDETIEKLSVEQSGDLYKRNQQTAFLRKADQSSITMMAKIIKGRLPKKEGEVAAEKWILLNLGIEPVVNQNFTVKNDRTGKTEEFKLVGILSDMTSNKKYGVLNLYTSLDLQAEEGYLAYIRFQDQVDYNTRIKELESELGISKKQVKICPAREDMQELYHTDAKVICVILIICMVVFYGVYRIASITRSQQYGILRAVGMKKGQLQKMILLELYQIYWASVPVGVGLGLAISRFIMTISGDRDIEIYLYNEKVKFDIIVPVPQIMICVLITACLVGIVGYMTGRKMMKDSIIETISGNRTFGGDNRSLFQIRPYGSKMGTIFRMGCKYIFRDIKTSILIILTICLGMTLFTGLAYKAETSKMYRDDTKEMWYLNGQYAMTMQGFGSATQGISRTSAEEIKKISDITSVKTSAGMPIRVIDEENVARNDSYYDDFNRRLKEIYGYTNSGYDGKDKVYKSVLYGYNKEALEALKKYTISGSFNPDQMDENEIILSILQTDDTKANKNPGYYNEGTPLMEYKVGDRIQIKYRTDFDTDNYDYEAFADSHKKYAYKTYKIAAIVSFPYMRDFHFSEYPLLITSDQQIRNLVPDSCIQCIYADGTDDMSLKEQMSLEQKLIQICNKNRGISTRSLISEIEQNEMFYHKKMIYIYSIAVVAFLLVMINMINNIKYRMQTRTREVCMLRAIGMSVAMTKKMMLFENVILGTVGILLAFVFTQTVLRYLYRLSDMRAFGHPFHFNYIAFFMISFGTWFVCIILSLGILKSWKAKQIIEGIGKIE